MSPSTQTDLERLAERAPALQRVDVAHLSRAAAFWSAVCLPVLYVPMLFGGLTAAEAPLFVALLLANVGALLFGHDHHADPSQRTHR